MKEKRKRAWNKKEPSFYEIMLKKSNNKRVKRWIKSKEKKEVI